MNRLTIADSFKNFTKAFGMLASNPLLRKWYVRAVARTFLIAIILVTILIVAGSYGLWTAIGSAWGSLASIIYSLLVLYVSGTLTATLSGALVQMVSGENSLLRALGDTGIHKNNDVKTLSETWKYRRSEYLGILWGVLVSITVWPFLLFPLTMPIGIFAVGWALGQGSHKSADRLLFTHGELTAQKTKAEVGSDFHLGLGLIPAALSLFPFVGWLSLPLLQVAAVLDIRDLSKISKAET